MPSCGYSHNGNFSINERVLRSTLSIPDDCKIVDVCATATVDKTEILEGRATVLGNIKYTLILCCNGEYSSADIVLPVKYEFDVDSNNISACESNMSVIFCRARMDVDNLGLDAEIGVRSSGLGTSNMVALDEINFGSDIVRHKGEITVCYKGEEDSLWGVAKKYHMPVSHIDKMNAVNGSIDDRRYIVI